MRVFAVINGVVSDDLQWEEYCDSCILQHNFDPSAAELIVKHLQKMTDKPWHYDKRNKTFFTWSNVYETEELISKLGKFSYKIVEINGYEYSDFMNAFTDISTKTTLPLVPFSSIDTVSQVTLVGMEIEPEVRGEKVSLNLGIL